MESAAASHCEPDVACNASERGAPPTGGGPCHLLGCGQQQRGDELVEEGDLEVEIAADRTEALRGEALARFDEVCSPLLIAYDLDTDRGWLRLRKAPAPVD